MIAAEFEPAKPSDRRRDRRAPVSLDARIDKASRTLCKVVDLSLHGARLQTYSALEKNSTIWLTLPGVESIAADVKWADDYHAGCQFHQPLDADVFERLLSLAR